MRKSVPGKAIGAAAPPGSSLNRRQIYILCPSLRVWSSEEAVLLSHGFLQSTTEDLVNAERG